MTTRTRAPRPPRGLQLDLACALVRLGQVEAELATTEPAPDVPFVLGRVFECDVPRLWQYLAAGTVAWLGEQGEDEPRLAVYWRERELHSLMWRWFGWVFAFAAGCGIAAWFMSPPW